jgi:hypothetical protein
MMAKTLIGVYDTVADAEQVVRALHTHGFARRDIRLATHRAPRAAG